MKANIAYMALSLIGKTLSGLVLMIFLSFLLPMEIYANYSYFIILTILSTSLFDFGEQLKLVKDLSSNKSVLHSIDMLIKVILLVLLTFIFFFIKIGSMFELVCIVLSGFFYSIYSYFISYCRGRFNFKLESLISISSELFVFTFLCISSLIFEYATFIFIFMLLRLLQAALVFNLVKIDGFWVLFGNANLRLMLNKFKGNLPYFSQIILAILLVYLDSFISKFFLDELDFSQYQLLSRYVVLFVFSSSIMSNLLLPYFAKKSSENIYLFLHFIKNTFKFVFLLSLISLLLVFCFLNYIFPFVYSVEVNSELSLILSLIVFIKFLSVFLGCVLTSNNSQFLRVLSQFLSILFFLTLIFVFDGFSTLLTAFYSVLFMNIFLLTLYLLFSTFSLFRHWSDFERK